MDAGARERLRVAVYGELARTGQIASHAQLAAEAGVSERELPTGLQELHEVRHLVLGADGEIVMAHPFATIPLGFSVMGDHTLWWGGCCWDSFALPHLLPEDQELLVATRCPGCGTPHAWSVNDQRPPDGDQVAHFLVPAAHIWDDVVHTCDNQRIFCSEDCVETWLQRTGNTLGYVMDLATLWRLASRWYEGRLDPGYVRREPEQAAAYFRDVGLRGPFWGLQD